MVAGVGSPHGDDQIGWWIVEMLRRRPDLPARAVTVSEPLELVEYAKNCQRLVIIDGCHTGAPAGTVTRLKWPDSRIEHRHAHSTHSVGIWSALRLAESMGQLPETIEIFGIEVGKCEPGAQPTGDVLLGLPDVEDMVFRQLTRSDYA